MVADDMTAVYEEQVWRAPGTAAPLLANLETPRGAGDPAAVEDQLGVPLWH